MCSDFDESMENYQGDLTDIILRASGKSLTSMLENQQDSKFESHLNWEFQSDRMNNFDVPKDNFGDPFSTTQDPLLLLSSNNSSNQDQLDMIGSSFFSNNSMNSMFPQLLQISSSSVSLPISPSESPVMTARVSGDMINVSSSKGCLVDNSPVQISSPRNPGIKRRKSQAKKVICVPAPAAANSRPSSGEVVPSDLWAWRKYGQKPIKGSPYPRGYYRCSSSKGCSARKQVERSRTDPNMLVITYTSEHNHAWPTQRNALAGSTRSQPSKTNANSRVTKEEENKEAMMMSMMMSSNEKSTKNSLSSSSCIKEEIKEIEKLEMDNDHDDDFGDQGFAHYRPEMPNPNNNGDDFFADLGEFEGDPLNLLFSQGFNEDEHKETNKDLDSFSIFDWSGGGEAKKDL